MIPVGKLKKVSSLKPVILKAPAIEGPQGKQGPKGLQGPAGPIGPAGRDAEAPSIEEIVKALLESPELLKLVQKEVGMRVPMGGEGKLNLRDLPGYSKAAKSTVFGINEDGKAGFYDFGGFDVATYTRLIDTESDYKYVGEALPGSAEDSSVWRIKRVEFLEGDDIEIKWAEGTSSFDKLWTNRTSYTYS